MIRSHVRLALSIVAANDVEYYPSRGIELDEGIRGNRRGIPVLSRRCNAAVYVTCSYVTLNLISLLFITADLKSLPHRCFPLTALSLSFSSLCLSIPLEITITQVIDAGNGALVIPQLICLR